MKQILSRNELHGNRVRQNIKLVLFSILHGKLIVTIAPEVD